MYAFHPWKTQRVYPHPYYSNRRQKPSLQWGAVNLHSTDEAVHLELLAPGFQKEEIKIELDGPSLIVRADKPKVETENRGRHEFEVPAFERRFQLSDAINREDVSARFENGILYLRLGMKPQTQKTEIAVA